MTAFPVREDYPVSQDYMLALQVPQALRRPELRTAEFALHPSWGTPAASAGTFAVVFRAKVADEDTALRFFISKDTSSRKRYDAVSAHIVATDLQDCVANATWVDDAIEVNGGTWPMVRMPWVQGITLDEYVGRLAEAADVAALWRLARTWRAFVARLQHAGFAHGDLQHGNVLVDPSGQLRLVDLDGSWVEALRGEQRPREDGHPNYQRTGRDWGRWMDTFPGLVIYTALLCLSRRPDAWRQLSDGENILFSADDFTQPRRTPCWDLLARLDDAEMRDLADRLQKACDPAWKASGSLETLLDGTPIGPMPTRPAPTPYDGPGRLTPRDWKPNQLDPPRADLPPYPGAQDSGPPRPAANPWSRQPVPPAAAPPLPQPVTPKKRSDAAALLLAVLFGVAACMLTMVITVASGNADVLALGLPLGLLATGIAFATLRHPK